MRGFAIASDFTGRALGRCTSGQEYKAARQIYICKQSTSNNLQMHLGFVFLKRQAVHKPPLKNLSLPLHAGFLCGVNGWSCTNGLENVLWGGRGGVEILGVQRLG